MRKISVVIRAYNEAPKLKRLLDVLRNLQVEIVVVDNGSTDGTAQLLDEYAVSTVHLQQSEFSYPKSTNLGVAASTGDIVVLFSAHCLPCHTDWLERVVAHFDDAHVAGVYGPVVWEKDSPWFEKAVSFPSLYLYYLRGTREIQEKRVGLMGGTNCAFRRSLWEEPHFDEAYGAGGEDTEWGAWVLRKGYTILHEPYFSVRHSHYLTFRKYLQQQRVWRGLMEPRPFDARDLSFRDDIKRV